MRFAIGSVPQLEQFMSSIDMGDIAKGATDLRSREKSAGIGLQGKVGGAGLRAKGQAISGGILGDAQAAAGRSQMMGSIFSTLGKVGGAAIGAGMFGGGGADGFSSTDAQTMGMPAGQADYIAGGGTTEWTTDMPINSWKKYLD